jgi:predicted Zn-dependent protease
MRRAAAIGLFTASVLISAPAAAQISIFGGSDSDDASGGLFGILTKAISQREALLGSVSEEKESQMGAAAADVLLGAAPLVDDPELQRYVNTVGLWIALQTERADLDWRFGVLEDNTANAFAAPAGYVFITKGLFLVLRTEAELAGVLAHEVSHVVERHHVNAMIKQERFKFLADAAQTVSGEGGLIADAAVAASKELYSKGLDKSLEFEADRNGVVVAARAGYDPYGLVHALMTLDGAGADPEFLGFFLSTHPATGDRLDALNTALETNVNDAEGAAPRDNLARMQARLLTLSADSSTPYQEADRPPDEKAIDESERSGGIRR